MQFQFPILENLCPSWGLVTHLGTCRRVAKGTVVLGMGSAMDGVTFVQEGVLETILVTPNGPEKVLYFVGEGCLFGEVCFSVGGPNEEVFVKARTDCVLHFFSRETIEGPIALDHPELLLEMVRILGHIVRMYGIQLQDSLSLDFFVRICRFLVYLVRFKGAEPAGTHAHVASGVSQGDLARLLGVHRVTVTKAVKKLKDRGVVRRFTKRELEITDYPGLLKLSEEWR